MKSIDDYTGSNNIQDLLFSVSFADRNFPSIEKILNKFKINRCILFNFNNYFDQKNYNLNTKDIITSKKYVNQYNKIIKYLKEKKQQYIEIYGDIFCLDENIKKLNEIGLEYPLIIDISCIPKNYILSILNIINLEKTIFVYSKVGNYSKNEDDFVVGNRGIVSLKGFNGVIRHRDSILILVLGFQGNRAMSIFRKYSPYKTLALIPDPKNETAEQNIYIASLNNHELLLNQFVISNRIPCFEPNNFKINLETQINSFIMEEAIDTTKYNMILGYLGPKSDILGLYKYWLEHKTFQIAYSLPMRYRDNSNNIGDTYIIKWDDIFDK